MKHYQILAAVFLVALFCNLSFAQEAQKYALLVGVNKYQHSRMNDSELKYPENDAKAVAKVLRNSGYTVEVLVGKDATQAAVVKELAKVGEQGAEGGAVLIGLFGHGVQYGKTAYYCPFNTGVRIVKDSQGNTIRSGSGSPRLEPKPESMVSMRDILDALTTCGASNRILMADCCRDDPSRARGRAFGTNLTTQDLPAGTVALFACSQNEQAFEHDDWKHGAFTHAFLKYANSATGKVTSGLLGDHMYESVKDLVKAKTNGASTQTLYWLNSGRVDLLLETKEAKDVPAKPVPAKATAIASIKTRGVRNSLGMDFRVIPKGSFLMGSPSNELGRSNDEFQHRVTLTQDFAIGTYEVNQRQWKQVMSTTPWKGKNSVSADESAAASYINWNDANLFCQKLSLYEGIEYRLPTEAEWEYACRGGQTSAFSFGDSFKDIWDFSWSSSQGSSSPQPGGTLKPNPYGLYDIHGNVWEWCSDWYDSGYYRNSPLSDPKGPRTGSEGVLRGGCYI